MRLTVRHSDAGFSLIEAIIAGGLIAFIAVASLPSVFGLMDSSNAMGFKPLCAGAVRAKLQEYTNGVIESSGYRPTGFEFTKTRFRNNFSNGICTTTPTATAPGMRETVYGNTQLASTATEYNPSAALSNTPAVMRGFQLWVNVRRYNPRVLQLGGTINTAGQGVPTRDCPTIADYQFYSLGDALEITVTGLVRTSPAIGSGGRGGAKVGKLQDLPNGDPNPLLTCSATEIVYPPRIPFRYYLGPDGKMRNYQASIAFSGGAPDATKQAMETHFRSVWVQSSDGTVDGTVPISNIRAFAVSPDNKWVYMLRPGELSRYGPCYDDGTIVKVGGVNTAIGGSVLLEGKTYLGTPDCPKLPSVAVNSDAVGPDGQVWSLDPNIENIAVNFGADLSSPLDDTLYAIYNSGATTTGGASSSNGILTATPPATASAITWTESSTYSLPTDRPRIKGIFIAHSFPTSTKPNLFFFDNTCFTGAGTPTDSTLNYCASIFSSGDTAQQQEMRELPLQVEAISY